MGPLDRQKFVDKCWVTYYEVGFGLWQYTCFTPEFACPIGFAWVLPIGGKPNMAHILHCYVHPHYRRRGVMRRINDEILKAFRLVHTWEGSKDGGRKFLEAAGYRYDENRRDWHLLRPAAKGRKK